ncbi:MAG: endonuclease/exonuclease/phosphatase family protein [Thiohalomonadaceae bacterium]
MDIAVVLIAVAVFAASVVPLVRREAWWVRVFDFPRLQFLLLALMVFALVRVTDQASTWPGRLALLAASAAALIQAARVFPYTPLAPREVMDARQAAPEDTLSLLIANVLMDNHASDAMLALVRACRPDLVLLLEPDAWWEAQMRPLEADWPHTVKRPLENESGMLLYSRLPLIEPETLYRLRDGIPSMRTQVQLPSGAQVSLHCVHPEPPSPTEAPTSLPRDAELLMVGREVKAHGGPTIVAGDLNDVAWSYTTRLFQKISGLLDPRRGRGMFNTFNAKVPLMRWPLDHVFHSGHFLLAEIRRLPAFGSDHFPVYVRLSLQPGEAVPEAPAPRPRDEQVAAEKTGRARQEEGSRET